MLKMVNYAVTNVILKINNLCKNFGDNKVLKGINTEIQKGDVVAIIGPSGCGKSTFLRCLNRLENATSGEIVVGDYRISDKKINIKY